MIEYIEIEKELIPYQFNIQLEGVTFTLGVNYNSEFDYFTLDLYQNGEVILYGEKVVYGKPLFTNFLHLNIPGELIVPLDLTEQETRVTYENLGEKVFLYVLEGEVDG
jgi:hypothetical protein